MDNVLHRHNWKRAAALTALFAILLIVVAPLISISLQKDPMSAMPGMHHDMSMMSMDEHHGDMPHTMPVDHAEACGYCVLFSACPWRDAGADRPAQRGAAEASRLSRRARRSVTGTFSPGFTLIPARRRGSLLFPLKINR